MSNYSDACTEVSIILSLLNVEEYNKIPRDIIEAIEKNKNRKYTFEFDYNVEPREQKLLKETKAILFNLFRDYLANSKQRETIIKMQNEERNKQNERKKLKYNVDDIFKKEIYEKDGTEDTKLKEENTALICTKKDSFIIKIINRIKNFFNVNRHS